MERHIIFSQEAEGLLSFKKLWRRMWFLFSSPSSYYLKKKKTFDEHDFK